MQKLTKEYLVKRIEYFPDTGVFKYRKRSPEEFSSERACNAWNARFSGKKTGCVDGRGYIQIKIDGVKHLAHRLAFIYMTGSSPELIDHIDRNKQNNSFSNLREADRSQNAANSKRYDCKGVFLRKSGRYSAQICVDYKIKHLGTFESKEEAVRAYAEAAQIAFGDFFHHQSISTESFA